MAEFGTFTVGQVLTAAELNAAGAYTAYTPTFTGFNIGNGTRAAYYSKFNKLVHYYGYVQLGTTSSMSGPLDISLPFTAAEGQLWEPSTCYFFNGATVYWGTSLHIATTFMRLVAHRVDSTYAYNADISASVPFTWGNTHYFFWNHIYKAA